MLALVLVSLFLFVFALLPRQTGRGWPILILLVMFGLWNVPKHQQVQPDEESHGADLTERSP